MYLYSNRYNYYTEICIVVYFGVVVVGGGVWIFSVATKRLYSFPSGGRSRVICYFASLLSDLFYLLWFLRLIESMMVLRQVFRLFKSHAK